MFEKLRQLFSTKKKKKKKNPRTHDRSTLSVFAVFNTVPILTPQGELDPRNTAPVAFASTYNEAMLSLERILFFKHFDHYFGWVDCTRNGKKAGFRSKTWKEYCSTVLDEEMQEYHILHLRYSAAKFAAILRVFSNLEPLYLPFEKQEEYQKYLAKITDCDGKAALPEELQRMMGKDKTLSAEVHRALGTDKKE